MYRTINKIMAILVVIHLFLPTCVSMIPAAQAEGITGRHHIELLKDREYFEKLLGAIGGAQKEIVMAFFLFKTNGYKSSYPDILLNHLVKAAERGVRIRVLLERGKRETSQVDQNNRETALRLRGSGISVSFDTPRRTTHTKVVVIDGRYTILGSHNLTSSALKYNHELSLFVDSRELATKTLTYINTLH